jgi:Holliday junction resolvasome RuvABC DNA-binding subunit
MEALQALMALGYARSVAETGLRDVLQSDSGSELEVEELVKRALKKM